MKKHGYVEGSGNVYADLGVINPQEARAKADLARGREEPGVINRSVEQSAERAAWIHKPPVNGCSPLSSTHER